MDTGDGSVQLLLNLGLSYSQAKMWLTLSWLGEANITEIARKAKIDRAEGSRAMQKLQRLGLVDEIINSPRRFKALSVKEGAAVLLHSKKQEYQNLVKSAEFFSKFHVDMLRENIENNYNIMALSGIDRLVEYSKKTLKNTEKCSDLCGDWHGFRNLIYENVKGSLNKMRTKGIPFRIVIKNPNNDSALEEFKNFSRKYTNAEIRFFELSEELLLLWIFDNREIIFAKGPDDFRSRVQSQEQVLMSNAPALLQMGQIYFEHVWENARPLKV